MTPEQLRMELFNVSRELRRAADAIYDYEVKAETDELKAQSAVDKAYLRAEGNIEDRKAIARESASEERSAAVVSKAVLNRAKLKAKHLELEQMRIMGTLKSIQFEGA